MDGNRLVWEERFNDRYDAKVHDCGKDGWRLTAADALTGDVFYEGNAGKPYSTTRVADLAFGWRDSVERAVYRYEHWSAVPAPEGDR